MLAQRLLCRWWYAVDWPRIKDIGIPPPGYEALEGFTGVFVSTRVRTYYPLSFSLSFDPPPTPLTVPLISLFFFAFFALGLRTFSLALFSPYPFFSPLFSSHLPPFLISRLLSFPIFIWIFFLFIPPNFLHFPFPSCRRIL